MQAKDLIVTGASRLLGKLKCLGDISTSGKVTATNGFEGNVVGNVSGSAGTAGAFTSAKSITLTGDVTGSASSTGGWSVATTVKDDSHNHTAATLSGVALSTDVLTKTNTTSYTPTADYHPATKKYVDDNLGGSDIYYFNITTIMSRMTVTYDEVYAAYNSGKAVYAVSSPFIYRLLNANQYGMRFGDYAFSTNSITMFSWDKETNVITVEHDKIIPINITSPTNGQILMYNSTSEKWENTTLPIYNGGVS